jgi:hypothetical protein
MQIVGARRTFEPRAITSSPSVDPILLMRSIFHVEARDIPDGNRAAFYIRQYLSRHPKEVPSKYLGTVFEILPTRSTRPVSRFDRRNAMFW